MKIGHIISKLRYENGLNQQDLATRLGVSKGAVGMWETDRRKPDYDMLVEISELFHVSTDYLLSHNVDSNNTICDMRSADDSATSKLVATFHSLNEDYQDILIGEAKKLLRRQISEEKNNMDMVPQAK